MRDDHAFALVGHIDDGRNGPRVIEHARRLGLNPGRIRHNHRVAGAPEVRCDLLGPLERGAHRVRPRRWEMIEELRSAEVVDVFEVVLPFLGEAVEEQVLID